MGQLTRRTGKRDLAHYNPDKGLKTIAVAEASEKHWRRAKDASKLIEAIEAKISAQADYVVWRDGVVVPSQKNPKLRGKRAGITAPKSPLPAADPGDVVAHRWRKRLTVKRDGKTVRDEKKIATVFDDVRLRCVRVCEQQPTGTIRGTEGTGEFERYTPGFYVEAVRQVLGQIDLDPASSKQAQKTVQAVEFFTERDDGLSREWHGRVFLNPPYHRDLAPLFIDKLLAEIAAQRVSAAIVLTNNSTDTEWFLRAAHASQAICFTNGRINFTQPNGEEVLPTQGQAFFYFGNDVDGFARAFGSIGFGVRLAWPHVEAVQ